MDKIDRPRTSARKAQSNRSYRKKTSLTDKNWIWSKRRSKWSICPIPQVILDRGLRGSYHERMTTEKAMKVTNSIVRVISNVHVPKREGHRGLIMSIADHAQCPLRRTSLDDTFQGYKDKQITTQKGPTYPSLQYHTSLQNGCTVSALELAESPPMGSESRRKAYSVEEQSSMFERSGTGKHTNGMTRGVEHNP